MCVIILGYMVKVFCYRNEIEEEVKMMFKVKWRKIEFDLNGDVVFDDDIYMMLLDLESLWKFYDDMLFIF